MDAIAQEAAMAVAQINASGALLRHIEAAMRKVRDAEREACAAVADALASESAIAIANHAVLGPHAVAERHEHCRQRALEIAAAIRERGAPIRTSSRS